MHFLVIKSRYIIWLIVTVIICALLCVSFNGRASAEVFFGSSSRKVPVYSVLTEEKQIAISFDSAWGAEKTEDILAVLEEYDVSATFFLVGIWVDEYPEKVKAIQDAGVEIGAHSNKHLDMTKLSLESMQSDLDSSISKIESVTGAKPKLFRSPFGAYSNQLIEECHNRDMEVVQWDVDTLDWKGISGDAICERVMKKVKNGSIILMHNNSDNVIEGLRLSLDRLLLQDYKITSVGELLIKESYIIDANGVQKPA